jgi:glycosyltransferase involved in cell wall biosynthesis
MELITIIFCLIVIDYVIFIGLLIYGFAKVKSFEKIDLQPKTTFSIIVPFRNEEKNFRTLLDSISQLNYPVDLFEIIVIDDFSNDNSEKIFNKWRMENGLIQTTLLENLRLSNSPKKDAISRAVHVVKNEWIITTDADCEVPKNWLLAFDNYIQSHDVKMLVGAVNVKAKWNPFHYFQQMDLMSLQGTTIGSFGLKEAFMCNGANFAYTKNLFNSLGGFNGNAKIASGDDVFLLQKAVKRNAEIVHYLKNTESIVLTKPENNSVKLFMQRVRWASKTGSYDSDFSKGLAVAVLLMNGSLVASCGLWVLGFTDWKLLANAFGLKLVVDYILLLKTNSFLRKGRFLFPIVSSLMYPFFSSFVGLYSLVGTFTWKDRSFKK